MHAAREYAEAHGHHVTILIGVVGEHDSELAQDLLTDIMARVMSLPDMPLLPNAIQGDCMVAPPERGGVHLELMWISV